MSAITPQTELKLLKVPIELDNLNQIKFNNATSQYNYFNSLEKIEVDDFTYQRKDSTIRFPENIDTIINYNYVMYRNDNFSNKWFYAFITNMEYINPRMTLITIKTDVYQTWQFDITFLESFVEREHVSDDTLGLHTVKEGLETGDYIMNSTPISLNSGGNNTYICCACSDLPTEMQLNTRVTRYGGIYSGVTYILFDEPLGCSNFIRAMDYLTKSDAIDSIFLIPRNLCNNPTFSTITISTPERDITTHYAPIPYSDSETIINSSTTINLPSTLNGYTPKNKKMFTGEFNYLMVSNNIGNDAIFHYEDFVNNTPSFKVVGTPTPGCSIKCYPLNYNKLAEGTGTSYSYNYGISGAKYPTCSWKTDVYINWLTQNGINLGFTFLNATETGVLSNLGGLALGVASENYDQIGSSIGGIFGALQSNYKHSLTPDQARGNTNTGDVTFSSHKMDIPCYNMCIKYEWAERIDKYLTMYGYKINKVKVPNLHSRTNWNYVKTINVNIEGYVPQTDLQELKRMFNSGITLWHTTTHFLDYSQNNSII